MDDYTPTTEEVRLLVVDGRWNTGAVDAVMFDRWLAERDREVAERAWAEGAQWAAVELQAIERVENQWVGRVTTRIGWVSHPPQNYRMKGTLHDRGRGGDDQATSRGALDSATCSSPIFTQ